MPQSEGQRPALTRISFQRDVRLFLAALFGFFIVLIAVLLLLLQFVIGQYEQRAFTQYVDTARIVADTVSATPHDAADLQALLIYLRGKYSIEAIAVTMPDGRVVNSGAFDPNLQVVSEAEGRWKVRCAFDDTDINKVRVTFTATAAISLTGGIIGSILLLLMVRRITRPIEALLDQARDIPSQSDQLDEANYLIETFRNTIAALRSHETELERLHALEKTRADDLEIIASTLTRTLSVGVLVLARDGAVLQINEAARALVSGSGTENVGESLDRFVSPEVRAILDGVIRRRQSVSRLQVPSSSGSLVEITVVPLFGPNNDFLGTVVLLNDVTEVKELESRVRQLQALADLGEMSAGIAHEFRNSLSTIVGYLQLMRKHGAQSELAPKIAAAEREAQALAKGVEGLLSFARPISLRQHEVPLRELLENIAQRLSAAASIPIIVDGADAVVHGDPTLLERAFENLLRNAVDAHAVKESAEPIRVTVEQSPVRIRIVDRGTGFDPAETARLMLPFQSDKPTGFGLGLPLARKIILAHGASLALHATQGEGVEAVVDFSSAAEPARQR